MTAPEGERRRALRARGRLGRVLGRGRSRGRPPECPLDEGAAGELGHLPQDLLELDAEAPHRVVVLPT